MKFVHDQEFYWRESYAFARARAATAPRPSRLRLAALLFVLFAIPLLFVKLPETVDDVQFVGLFAATAALLMAYVVAPLVDKLPNGVMIASNRIVVGQRRILLTDVASAIVGTTRLQGHDYPILAIQMRNQQSYLFGLGPEVNQDELSSFLQKAGIREPQA